MGNRKADIHILQTDDGCFSIELCSGMFHRKTVVAENSESLVSKVSVFLKEFAGGTG
jgi:hypothetical protein